LVVNLSPLVYIFLIVWPSYWHSCQPLVHFINILWASFIYFCAKKLQSQIESKEELHKTLLYKIVIVKWCRNWHLKSTALCSQIPRAQKYNPVISVFFEFLGSWHEKEAHETFVKLTPIWLFWIMICKFFFWKMSSNYQWFFYSSDFEKLYKNYFL